jgi:hypothetical protein
MGKQKVGLPYYATRRSPADQKTLGFPPHLTVGLAFSEDKMFAQYYEYVNENIHEGLFMER